ncbi:MAG: hypothetical protein GWN16_09335, partial [Calditrichae bacterium]|nr:hypothetical protein [Calditrichia bacterium]NIW79636.1 hypothetical protein [Calditrichia bacterium]
ERGIVHIHTSAPDSGISLKSRTWIGNETGDPGPYLFIDEASDNVDRSGPDNSFYLDMGFKNWYARLSYVDHNHYLTDPAIRHRNWLRSNSYLRIQTASPALRIGIKDFEGAHELLITHTTTDDLGFLNLQGAAPLFFSPLSEEIPSKRIFNYAGIKGTVPVNPSFDIFYCVKRSSTELAQNPNQRESRNLDWKLTNYAANFE